MTEFRMPDSYYDPPEYDGCEDCECEDPEHPERPSCTCDVTDYRDCDPAPCEIVCTCKCHNLPPEPDEYDLFIDRQMDAEHGDHHYYGENG